MRVSNFVLCLLLATVGAINAVSAGTVGSKFADLSYRQGTALTLSAPEFGELTAIPRGAGAAVLFTAVEAGAQCEACRQVQPQWDALAKQWSKRRDSSLVFGTLDFFHSRDVFLKLGVTHAPVLLYFPPGSDGHFKYDFAMASSDADDIAKWLSLQRDAPVPYTEPFPWVKVSASIVALVAVSAALYALRQHAQLAANFKVIWTLLAMGIIVTQTAGYMWNQIHHAPLAAMGRDGNPLYVAPGSMSQFKAETGILSGLYLLSSLSVVALVKPVPTQPSKGMQRTAIIVWSGLLLFCFSALIYIFRLKMGIYPFRLLL